MSLRLILQQVCRGIGDGTAVESIRHKKQTVSGNEDTLITTPCLSITTDTALYIVRQTITFISWSVYLLPGIKILLPGV